MYNWLLNSCIRNKQKAYTAFYFKKCGLLLLSVDGAGDIQWMHSEGVNVWVEPPLKDYLKRDHLRSLHLRRDHLRRDDVVRDHQRRGDMIRDHLGRDDMMTNPRGEMI